MTTLTKMLLLLAGSLLLGGCGTSTNDDLAAPRETWDIVTMRGQRLGQAHVQEEPVVEAGRPAVRVTAESELTVRRFNETVVQRVVATSWETRGGVLLRFESKSQFGPQPLLVSGRVDSGQLKLQTTVAGQSRSSSLPWPEGAGGFNAVEQSLRRRPMQPGETRTIKALMPVVNQLATTTLTAHGYESTELLAGQFVVLRIDAQTLLGGTESGRLDVTYWTDRAGEVMKCRIEALDQTVHRTTREFAQQTVQPATLDLGHDTLVRLDRPLDKIHRRRQATYRVTIRNGDPTTAFVNDLNQTVRSTGPHSAEVTVNSLTTADLVDPPHAERPLGERPAAATPAESRPSAMIQSDDPRVVRLAAEAAGDETDPARLAARLERFVHERVENKNFSQVYASAAEVAQSMSGDCTEHAVLLAGLARARGMPARVALGLVYAEREQAFGFHMWTEVLVAGRWLPLDATLGQGGIGAGHLKLAQSSLSDEAGWGALLSVTTVLGRLTIEPVESDPKNGRSPAENTH